MTIKNVISVILISVICILLIVALWKKWFKNVSKALDNFFYNGASKEKGDRLYYIQIISNVLMMCLLVWFAIVLLIYLTFLVWDLPTGKEVDGVLKAPALLIGFLFGILGGLCSLHRRIKHLSDEDLFLLAKPWRASLLSPLIGGFMAVVLYIAFIAKFIEGSMFPEFESISRDTCGNVIKVIDTETSQSNGKKQLEFESIFDLKAVHGVEDYGKLLVWSFLAGFSELLVVNLLMKGREEQFAQPKKQEEDKKSD